MIPSFLVGNDTKETNAEIRIACIGNADAGKCLHPETPILTLNGVIPIKQLNIGDMVIGDDLLPSQIVSRNVGRAQTYTITDTKANLLYRATINHQMCLRHVPIETFGQNEIGAYFRFEFLTITVQRKLLYNTITYQDSYSYYRAKEMVIHSGAFLTDNDIIDLTIYDYINLYADSRKLLTGVKMVNNKIETYDFIVGSVREDDYIGISINNTSKRFILGNGIITHNSTTIGVLKANKLDDGNGARRNEVANFQHEIDTGMTSSIGHQHMEVNDRIYTFVDLAGQETYLKTTIHGLSANTLDYAMLVMSASNGFPSNTRKHFALALCLQLPIFMIITKTDITPEEVYEENLKLAKRCFQSDMVRRVPFFITNQATLQSYYSMINNDMNKLIQIIPIIKISNVTGKNVDLMREFIFNLRSLQNWVAKRDESPMYIAERCYNPKGAGFVLSGFSNGGTISVNQKLYFGPYKNGQFCHVVVRSIRDVFDKDVQILYAGNSGCLAIRAVNAKSNTFLSKTFFHKGMNLLEKPYAVSRFKASIKILHHPTTIKLGYEPVLHCCSTKHAVKIVEMDREILKRGEDAIVTLQFTQSACYIKKDAIFFIREGETKGYGTVLEIDKAIDAKVI